MFCPACGEAASEEQKFCRACGMHLEVVYHLVVEHWQEEVSEGEKNKKRSPLHYLGIILSLTGGVWFIILAMMILTILASADVQAKLWDPRWSQIALGAFILIFVGLAPEVFGTLFDNNKDASAFELRPFDQINGERLG